MKKILSLVLVVLMVVSMMPAIFAAGIDHDKYEPTTPAGDISAAKYISGLGILKGYPNGSLGLNDSINRWMWALLAARVTTGQTDDEDWKSDIHYTTRFDDVKEDPTASDYAGAIAYAASKGFIRGKYDAQGKLIYAPNDTITYQDALTIAVRILGYESEEMNAGYPYSYVEKAYELKLNEGISGIKLKDEITRGTSFQILFNVLFAQRAKVVEIAGAEIVIPLEGTFYDLFFETHLLTLYNGITGEVMYQWAVKDGEIPEATLNAAATSNTGSPTTFKNWLRQGGSNTPWYGNKIAPNGVDKSEGWIGYYKLASDYKDNWFLDLESDEADILDTFDGTKDWCKNNSIYSLGYKGVTGGDAFDAIAQKPMTENVTLTLMFPYEYDIELNFVEYGTDKVLWDTNIEDVLGKYPYVTGDAIWDAAKSETKLAGYTGIQSIVTFADEEITDMEQHILAQGLTVYVSTGYEIASIKSVDRNADGILESITFKTETKGAVKVDPSVVELPTNASPEFAMNWNGTGYGYFLTFAGDKVVAAELADFGKDTQGRFGTSKAKYGERVDLSAGTILYNDIPFFTWNGDTYEDFDAKKATVGLILGEVKDGILKWDVSDYDKADSGYTLINETEGKYKLINSIKTYYVGKDVADGWYLFDTAGDSVRLHGSVSGVSVVEAKVSGWHKNTVTGVNSLDLTVNGTTALYEVLNNVQFLASGKYENFYNHSHKYVNGKLVAETLVFTIYNGKIVSVAPVTAVEPDIKPVYNPNEYKIEGVEAGNIEGTFKYTVTIKDVVQPYYVYVSTATSEDVREVGKRFYIIAQYEGIYNGETVTYSVIQKDTLEH